MFSLTKQKSPQLQAVFYHNRRYARWSCKLSTSFGHFACFFSNIFGAGRKNSVFRQIFYEKLRRFLFFEMVCPIFY